MFAVIIAYITTTASAAGVSALQWIQSPAGQQYLHKYGHVLIHKVIQYFEEKAKNK